MCPGEFAFRLLGHCLVTMGLTVFAQTLTGHGEVSWRTNVVYWVRC